MQDIITKLHHEAAQIVFTARELRVGDEVYVYFVSDGGVEVLRYGHISRVTAAGSVFNSSQGQLMSYNSTRNPSLTIFIMSRQKPGLPEEAGSVIRVLRSTMSNLPGKVLQRKDKDSWAAFGSLQAIGNGDIQDWEVLELAAKEA